MTESMRDYKFKKIDQIIKYVKNRELPFREKDYDLIRNGLTKLNREELWIMEILIRSK
jgi:hypothetical protein